MDQNSPEAMIGEYLNQRGLTLAAAESCTGGLVCHRITNVPGASSYFVGGVVAYANETKISQLGVRKETLDEFGAVSRETVIEMARGVRDRFNVDIGISISGIAGPDGGTPEKPVGLTWIALCSDRTEQAWQYIWPGDRIAVKEQSSQAVLQRLLEYLSRI